MTDKKNDIELMRQMHTVLVLHFLEGKKQSDIAELLNLSTSKVNRLITQGRKMGMVKIDIENPFQRLTDLEKLLESAASLSRALVTSCVPGSSATTLKQVGRSAANHLVETIRDGDVIAITGGKAIGAVVQNIETDRTFDVTVVPLTGGVQGKYYTDVNHLATQLAERLGGKTMLVHAPLFAESREQRDMLMEVASIKQVFDIARKATVALVGVGSIRTPGSSYYDLHPMPEADRKMLAGSGVDAEFLAHLIRQNGTVADFALNSRLVALRPDELRQCSRVIGVASGEEKVLPIQAVLNGNHLHSLIVDEETASAVLATMEGAQNVA
ncbi:sugar-binding transcriptional regulator [Roseibium salinum]|uniref:Sugar-binding transcriptional regulator n=1 Tax=Roseibium salinum TaxID=1604349 RepID=A0ABT3QWT6_9HYPH|nr:sugar-binding transcriptional regulator [Roseibium sp. DSM 29163]MCX2721399.1 sugar-binding transcriptional regulator [Roseibium sp. DSM 29163]MDN3721881.1 sugar-binding transcriptional regulator [Roseibium salinum]